MFLYYGVIAAAGTYYLQTGAFSWQVFCAGGVWGLISMCVLLMPVLAYLAFGWSWAMLVVVPSLCLFVAVTRAEGKTYILCLLSAGLTNVFYTILVAIS